MVNVLLREPLLDIVMLRLNFSCHCFFEVVSAAPEERALREQGNSTSKSRDTGATWVGLEKQEHQEKVIVFAVNWVHNMSANSACPLSMTRPQDACAPCYAVSHNIIKSSECKADVSYHTLLFIDRGLPTSLSTLITHRILFVVATISSNFVVIAESCSLAVSLMPEMA